MIYRKVEGEGKDKGHGGDDGRAASAAVPLRRWEDWERSRLKKMRRDEKRRRDLARNFPGGYYDGDDHLHPRHDNEVQSSYYENMSDTISIVSSAAEDDQWGTQIGAYNENHSAFPPPPATLLAPQPEVLQHAQTVGMDELEAMLDQGFEVASPTPSPMESSRRHSHRPPPNQQPVTRYQLSERAPLQPQYSQSQPIDSLGPLSLGSRDPTPPRSRAISPISPTTSSHGISSALGSEWKTHAKKRSGGGGDGGEDWGPLGPLGEPSRPPPPSRRI